MDILVSEISVTLNSLKFYSQHSVSVCLALRRRALSLQGRSNCVLGEFSLNVTAENKMDRSLRTATEHTAQNETACGSSFSPPRPLSVLFLSASASASRGALRAASELHQMRGSRWGEGLRVRDVQLTQNQLIKKQLGSSYLHLQAHTSL